MDVMTTTVVNIRLHDYDVYMGRAGRGHDGYFGNPKPRARNAPPGNTLNDFSDYFFERMETDPEFRQRVIALKGKRLGCFCVDEPWSTTDTGAFVCHAQIIAHHIESIRE